MYLKEKVMNKLLPLLSLLAMILIISCSDNGIVGPSQNRVPTLPDASFEYMTESVRHQLDFGILNSNGTFNIDNSSTFMAGDMFFIPSNDVTKPVTAILRDELTDEKATLGRVLFYDNQLSVNNAISCGSCHQQQKAFADGQKLTPGFKGDNTDRNTISIANTMTQDGFFWDNNVAFLEDQVLNPVQNHKEMGMEDLSLISAKLAKTTYYGELFNRAYGSEQITNEKVSDALTQFMIAMVSDDSKFSNFADRIMQGEPDHSAGLSSLELSGFQLFNSAEFECSSCHKLPKLSARSIATSGGGQYEDSETVFISETQTAGPGSNIGLDIQNSDAGNGQNGFKIPSLLNVGLTAPYMHDGRFANLDQVMDHYSHGIKDNQNLDSRLKTANGNPVKMNFTEFERQALVAFLHTLTDETYLADEKFSDPFLD